MRKIIIGMFSLVLGATLLIDSIPGITGNVISSPDGFNLASFCGLVLFACGFALFILDARERINRN